MTAQINHRDTEAQRIAMINDNEKTKIAGETKNTLNAKCLRVVGDSIAFPDVLRVSVSPW